MADKSLCSITDCDKTVYARGLCNSHWYRLKKHGDPLAGKAIPGAALRFIHEVVIPHSGAECLIWPFSRSKGYGQVRIGEKLVWAHRYVCTHVRGEPPTKKHEAAHNCGNGRGGCVNPNHLEWKTHVDNMADKTIHGTHHRGERHGQAKLTEADVREIRRLKGTRTPSELAESYGVAASTIRHIQVRATWSWVE